MTHNWFKPGYVSTFGSLTGTIHNDGTSVLGSSPGFVDEANQIYTLALGSACINSGTLLHSAVLPANDIVHQYVKHQSSEARPSDGSFDIGAYEHQSGIPADLVITTSSLPNGTVGDPYVAMMAGAGDITPYTWSLTSGSLPVGLSLNSLTGEISGTPIQPESSNFTVQMTDAQTPPDSASKPLAITVESAQVDPVNITTASLPSARRNRNYNQSLQATGGATPYQWSIVSGSLAPGLNLNAATGVIAGKATTLGTWSFVVQVRDSQNPPATDTQNLSITVRK